MFTRTIIIRHTLLILNTLIYIIVLTMNHYLLERFLRFPRRNPNNIINVNVCTFVV